MLNPSQFTIILINWSIESIKLSMTLSSWYFCLNWWALRRWMQADGWAPGCTDLRSLHAHVPSRQPLGDDKICQSVGMQAGVWPAGQTDTTVWSRRGSETEGWAMFDVSPGSSINRHLSKPSRLFRDATDTTVWRQRWQTKVEVGKRLLICLWSAALGMDKTFDLRELLSDCEAGNTTTLETKIVTEGKHEISAHLLLCLTPREMVLKEISRILFAVSSL